MTDPVPTLAPPLAPRTDDEPSLPETVPPYAGAADHLGEHLSRVSLCLERMLRLSRANREPAAGDAPLAAGDAFRVQRVEAALDTLDVEMAARLAVSRREGVKLPLLQLQERFGLSDDALSILVAAAAPAFDVELGKGYAELLSRDGGQPDVAFLVELLSREREDEKRLLAELSQAAPLARHRLVRLGPPRGWIPEGPLLRRPVAVAERVVEWMEGRTGFEAERTEHVAQLSLASSAAQTVPPRLLATLARALEAQSGGNTVLLVTGPPLAGKATAICAAAAAMSPPLPTMLVDLEALFRVKDPPETARDLLREARLQGAILCFRRGEILTEAKPEQASAIFAILDGGGVPMVVSARAGSGGAGELLRRIPNARPLRVELPPAEAQAALWSRVLPASIPRASDLSIDDIVKRYRLGPGDILEAGAQAAATAQLRGPDSEICLEDVVTAVRARLRHRLGDVAELVTTSLAWPDLILREDALERVKELVSSVRHHEVVMERWGFAKKLAYGRACSALFSGPPGTGKTMVAALIARELGLELFRVDLSRIVSKWVGETEKNLGRAFDEAENSKAILLFDEADALFAKRTDVKSSNDRYANLEVNYLLQRLESFEGIVLLTTNNQSSIDDAFRRRLRFRIDFPTPDEEERERLWQSMLPQAAPVEPDLEFDRLARKYEMTGGYIKNAVVRAAYLAAASPDEMITQEILQQAARLEWEDMGKLSVH